MKKIIVPIDFSDQSEKALQTAALLAKKTNASIIVLHMLDIQDINFLDSSSFLEEESVFLIKLAERRIESFLDKEYLIGVSIDYTIKPYKKFSKMNEVVKEFAADLIIMGSQGTSGLKEFFVGSNTEKVIRYSDAPVLVIKNTLADVNFSDVVFATDFSEKSIPAFKKMLQVLSVFGARKHILYVNLPNEGFKTTAEMDTLAHNFLMKAEGNVDRLVNVNFVCERSIEEGISNFSNVVGADLISTATNARKGLAHIFSGSITEDVANHFSLPIITFKI